MKYRCNAIVHAIQVKADNFGEIQEFCLPEKVSKMHDGSICVYDERYHCDTFAYIGCYIVDAASSPVFGVSGYFVIGKKEFESIFYPEKCDKTKR